MEILVFKILILAFLFSLSWAGNTWNLIPSNNTSIRWNQGADNGQIGVVVGSAGMISTSVDGVQWTNPQSISNKEILSIASQDSTFVAVGDSGLILFSTNASDWTVIPSLSKAKLRAVISTNQGWLAVGDSLLILHSMDGKTWDIVSSKGIDTLYGIASSGQKYVAVGSSGVVLISEDTQTWIRESSGPDNTLYSVIWDGSSFIAGGYNLWAYNCYGLILTSTEGKNWQQAYSGSSKEIILGLSKTSTGILASGYYGTLLSSSNGTTWDKVPMPTSTQLRSITPLFGNHLIVGNSGTMLTDASLTPIWNTNHNFSLELLDRELLVQSPVDAEISLINPLGQELLHQKFSPGLVSLGHFQPGQYWLKIEQQLIRVQIHR